MPVMNGIEAARQIQEIAPNTGMVITMHSNQQLLSEAKAVGVSALISKGITSGTTDGSARASRCMIGPESIFQNGHLQCFVYIFRL